MKNTTLLMLVFVIIVLVGGFIFVGGKKNGSITGNVVQNPEVLQGPMQKVVLSMKNYNYYPQEVKVKAGSPVELTLDSTVSGCLRAFTIRELGISKISRTPNEKIEFTPGKKGTFTFSCSMGMGYGKLIVE